MARQAGERGGRGREGENGEENTLTILINDKVLTTILADVSTSLINVVPCTCTCGTAKVYNRFAESKRESIHEDPGLNGRVNGSIHNTLGI